MDDQRAPRGVWWIAGGTIALLLAVAGRYGWHRDELYFLEAGDHLQWGFVDQPPFTPFVAGVVDAIAPGNLLALRVLPAVATGLSIVLGARIVRELGGSRGAQVAGAAVLASGGFLLGVGHLLSTAVFDLTAALAVIWLLTRLLRTEDTRLWFWIGTVAGLALLNKSLVVLLVGALVAGLVADRRWDLLWTPRLVGGGVIALAVAAPNLAWQASNGWPQLDMAEALSERLAGENRATLVPLQLLFVGPFLVGLLYYGARWLSSDGRARPFRPLVWSWPIGLVITFATGGRPYYALPFSLVIALAGVVAWETRSKPLRRLAVLAALNAAFSVPLALPVLPMSATRVSATVNEAVAETVGWPELVDQVADAVETLPESERRDVVLLAATYGEAGAIDRFGGARGLPQAYSGHNGYGFFRRPTNDTATVVAIRHPEPVLLQWFEECETVDVVDNGFDVDNEVQGTPIVVCRELRRPWAETWPEIRFLS